MDVLLKTLHGPYTYVIVFQVLLISVLLLMLLWFLVKRTLRNGLAETGGGFGAIPDSMALNDQSAGGSAPATEEPKEPLIVARNETKRTDSQEDKVAYLESKLLEYEILQEELDSLRDLKKENESLKEQLAKAGLSASPTATSEPVASVGRAEGELAPEPSVGTVSEPSDADSQKEPHAVPTGRAESPVKQDKEGPEKKSAAPSQPDSKDAEKAAEDKPKEEVQLAKEEPSSETADEGDSETVLAGILDQLDELTDKEKK